MKEKFNENITAEENIRTKVLAFRDNHASNESNLYHKNIYLDKIVAEDYDSEENSYSKEIISLMTHLLSKANELYHSCKFEAAKSILECLLPLSWKLPTTLGNLEGLICQYLGAILFIQYRPDAAMYLHYKDLELSRTCKDASR